MNKIFVYGTLRLRGVNTYLIIENGGEHLGVGWTKNDYSLTISEKGLPFVSKHPFGAIIGDLFLIDDETLNVLDGLERHPHWYKREETEIELENGTTHTAWIYFNEDEGKYLIQDGDYIRFLEDNLR